MIEKGTVIEGPNGQYYRVARDCHGATPVLLTDFEPFGGAPEPKANEGMVSWLNKWLQDRQTQ